MSRRGSSATSSTSQELNLLLAGLKAANNNSDLAEAVQAISEHASCHSLHTKKGAHTQQAKQLAPFYIEVIKQAFIRLSASQKTELLRTSLQLAQLALEGLHAVRHVLKGRAYEVEVQRYALVRRLVSLKAFPEALEQGWVLYDSLCQLWPVADDASKKKGNSRSLRADKAVEREGQENSYPRKLPLQLGGPEGAQDSAADAVTMVVGTVLNLALCTVEGCSTVSLAQQLQQVLSPLEQLAPWLKLLPKEEAQKHNDTLFRCLYKAALLVLDKCSGIQLAFRICQALAAACIASSAPLRLSNVLVKLDKYLPTSDMNNLLAWCLAQLRDDAQSTAIALAAIDSFASQCTEACDFQLAANLITEAATRQSACAEWRLLGLYGASLHLRSSKTMPTSFWLPALRAAEQALASFLEQLQESTAVADEHRDLLPTVLKAITYLRKSSAPPASDQPASWQLAEDEAAASGADCISNVLCSHAMLLRAASRASGMDDGPSLLAKYSYPAISGLVVAAQIRCFSALGSEHCQATPVCDVNDFRLFWEEANASEDRHDWHALLQLKGPELHWVSSVMHSVGTALCSANQHSLATAPLRVAAQCAAVCASLSQDSASAAQPLRDAVGSCDALVSCHLMNEDRDAAIKDVQGAIMLWQRYGIPAQQWRPLLRLLICSWLPSREPDMPPVHVEATAVAPETAAADFVCLLDSAVPLAALASLLQEAVLALHSAVDDGSLQDSTGHAACQALLAKLLHEVCPIERDARGHASTLLLQAAVSWGVNNDARIALIEAAVAILNDALPDGDDGDAEAAYECGAAHALLALELALAARGSTQQSDSQVMVEPSKSAGNMDGIASEGSETGNRRGAELQPAKDESKWQGVRKHAHQAVLMWQNVPSSTRPKARCKLALALSSPWLVRELAALACVQGRWDDQQQACQTAAKLADALGLASDPSELRRCPISQMLIPAALREDGRSLHGDLQSEHPSLWRQEADRLAREGGGDPAACLKRALLHQCLASLSMQSGSLAVALFDASEALRISGSACEKTIAPRNACLMAYGGGCTESVGWWQASSVYLTCLLQIGELHELLGAPDDAIRAFNEGKQLALAQDAILFQVTFNSRLAEVRGKLGAWAEAEDHLAAAQCALDLGQDACPDSVAFIAMDLSRVAGGIARRQGDVQRALGLYHQASRALAKAPTEGDLAWAAVRLCAQVCLGEAKCQLQLGHAQKAAGLARQAQQSLEDFSEDGREHPMQRAAAVLVLAELAAHAALECTSVAEVEVWGFQKPVDGKAKANPKGGRGRGKAASKAQSVPSKPVLQEHLQPLLWALEVSQHAPQLLRRVSNTLGQVCASLGCPSAAAYFLQASLGASMRVQCQAGIQAQLLIAQRQGRPTADAGAIKAKQHARNTLQVWPDGEQARDKIDASNIEAQAQDRLQELLSLLPEGSVMCSISNCYSTAPAREAGFSLLISRCAPGRQSLTIRLTLPAEALQVAEEATCSASPLEVFGSILHDSAASMEADVAEESVAQRRQWWRKRVALDLRMAALLAHLDQKWLGPWRNQAIHSVMERYTEHIVSRCLLLGRCPELEASGCIETAVQSLLGELVSLKGGTDVLAPQLLGDLVELTMLGVPAISAAELHAAIAHICRIARVPTDDAQAAELADLFRARYKDVVRSAQVQPGTVDPDLASEASPVPLLDISNAGVCGDTLRRCRPQVVGSAVREPCKPQALQADAGDSAPRPTRARRSKATAGKLAAAAETEEPIAQSARKPANRKLFNIPESPAASGRALRDRDLATPAAKAGTTRAAMSARSTRTGLMSRMQAAAEGCNGIPGPTPSHAPSRASRLSKTTSRLAMCSMDVDGPTTAHCVSDTDSDDGGSGKEDNGGFVLHRGAATELGELASRMRGLALEQAADAQQGGGAEVRSDEVTALVDREAVVLVLDAHLQVLPWESLPGLKGQRMYRMPSLASACYLSEQRALRSQLGTYEAGLARAQHTAVDVSSTLYMLNPSGDLPATQAVFEVLFAAQPTWKGTVGEPMAAQDLAAGLQAHDLFLYCGHGAGEQYIPQRLLRRLPICAAALLMGCSSGSLVRKGCYEATGPILAYLEAGCPAAVANLWDVTDRDIDRFCRAVLDGWLAPSQSSHADEKPAHGCLSMTVAANRLACRLPHLIGAAPVCYGLPTVVRKVESK